MREIETGQIAFRFGVDEHGAKPPSQFPHRFAVLTWINRGGDGTNPWSLLRKCIPSITEIISADNVRAEFWKREKRVFRKLRITKIAKCAWSELMKQSSEELHENAEFPDKLRFERQDRIVLLAETEWWSSVGGPKTVSRFRNYFVF
jgi:hypothetical protein